MKSHKIILCVGLLLSQVTYKLRRVYNELEAFEYIGERKVEGETYKFWLEMDKELLDTPGLPEMTNKLMNCPVFKLTKRDKTYEINPFKYIKMFSQEGEIVLGYFSELKYVDKNLVCFYTGGDYWEYDKKQRLSAKVIYSKGKGEAEIEKYFSGTPSEYVLKVSGDFLCNKRQQATVYYVVIGKDGKIEAKDTNKEKTEEEERKEEEQAWMNFGPDVIEKLNSMSKKRGNDKAGREMPERNEREEVL